MKKLSLMIIFAVLCLAIFVGCKNNQNPPDGSHEHSFSEWKTVKQASCTEEGQKERTCACGEKETVTVPMTTHNFVNGVCDKCGAKPSEGLEYTLNSDGKSYSVSGIGTCTDKNIIIPDTYKSLPVNCIKNDAFNGCAELTSIAIADSVTSIDYRAFCGCKELTSITIPDSVTSIGSSAFSGCKGLTSIAIPDGVTKIDIATFEGCTGLTSIIIPDSVTSIDDRAFYDCTELANITIPDSVTSLGFYTFFKCTKLTSITIPNSMTKIGIGAFFGCAGLTSIMIPESVTSICDSAFSGCTGLTNIDVDSKNTYYHSVNNCLIETASKKLITGRKNSIIPDDGSVTSIGNYAFCACKELTSITIPSNVTSIGDCAFSSCEELTIITIPNSVTSMGDYAFIDCKELTGITIPSSVTSIGKGTFSWCTKLEVINFNGTKDQWNAMQKGDGWDKNTGEYVIHCTDGDITK